MSARAHCGAQADEMEAFTHEYEQYKQHDDFNSSDSGNHAPIPIPTRIPTAPPRPPRDALRCGPTRTLQPAPAARPRGSYFRNIGQCPAVQQHPISA